LKDLKHNGGGRSGALSGEIWLSEGRDIIKVVEIEIKNL
jgi:hypothetical protein